MNNERKLTAKESAAVEYYCNPASETYNNWGRSCLKANYAKCVGWETNANRVLHKDYIQAAIGAYQAKTVEKIEHTRQTSLAILDRARAIAEAQKNPSAMVAAEREKNAISNLHGQQPLKIEQDIKHCTAQTEAELLRKRMGLLNRMRSAASGIERN